MRSYNVVFEIVHRQFGILPIFFHSQIQIEANNEEEAKLKAQEAFNSHPNNIDLERKIVEVEELKL
ncbi:hypothetical protein JRU67_09275 [Mammaliicoccus sciuri]|uniref:Uncharacterized protein n=1 Tax=Mammaliicoccus sciuri TaxID=1296 RepID=A0AB37HJ95_MAMSC|nr:hypothetical protein [Mammaliicoccus sciuri]QRN90253.1 hypothetical protein JRU67_09275 [Mammaliicoccus sciuri]